MIALAVVQQQPQMVAVVVAGQRRRPLDRLTQQALVTENRSRCTRKLLMRESEPRTRLKENVSRIQKVDTGHCVNLKPSLVQLTAESTSSDHV
jgi:hypothetical protein